MDALQANNGLSSDLLRTSEFDGALVYREENGCTFRDAFRTGAPLSGTNYH